MTDTATTTDDRFDTPVHVDTGDELDALVAEHEVVLVDFYTKGCTLCQAVEPVVGNVARATDAVVAMCNPRTDLDLVDEYDVRSVPTLVLFADGEEVDRRADGFVDTDELVSMVERYV
ncbi:thioredoxin family protein [Halostella sp. JP-L12]|uniref:thioredoxin family protein n=1 Tax=Halostella TaxID=1843185 RepID=UPI000EF7E2B7|nr:MULTISPECIES: thioredoxin family protein [Halostella]NHN47886.1 thioredoxin family protein [Halostella sp. JP-L12]